VTLASPSKPTKALKTWRLSAATVAARIEAGFTALDQPSPSKGQRKKRTLAGFLNAGNCKR